MGEMKWYVLRAAGGKEKKAKEYLEKEIERSGLQDSVAQVLVPVKKEIVTKNGKRKAVDKLLFPGYVLIQAELSAKLENIIRNLVPGMSGFLTEKKTTWPTWAKLQSSATLVIVTTVLLAAMLWVIDYAFQSLMTGIYTL